MKRKGRKMETQALYPNHTTVFPSGLNKVSLLSTEAVMHWKCYHRGKKRLKSSDVMCAQACKEQQYQILRAAVRSQGHSLVTVMLFTLSTNEGRNDMLKSPLHYLPTRWCERGEWWHAPQQPLIRYHIYMPRTCSCPENRSFVFPTERGQVARAVPLPSFFLLFTGNKAKIFPVGS